MRRPPRTSSLPCSPAPPTASGSSRRVVLFVSPSHSNTAAPVSNRGPRAQMLADEPNNKNLLDLREQLTNAITQLQVRAAVAVALSPHPTSRGYTPPPPPPPSQGTKEMVARTQASRRPGMPGIGAAFAMGAPEKGPSCRKNKAQRCSVCGGIGHKSRTCSVVQQQQALQQQQQMQMQMQHQAGVQMHQASTGMPVQVPVYAAVPACPPQVQVTASAPPPLAAALPAPPMATVLPTFDTPPAEIAMPTAEPKTEALVESQGAS